ncbi:hypothetical protein PUN28_019057 [Cardiocondyla obscurior]|uniref:Uncharacterized protein n=1 Tax=Cardiocondyla obscurior TaxID=286306 RepID=A0AAW2EEK7_9HYME
MVTDIPEASLVASSIAFPGGPMHLDNVIYPLSINDGTGKDCFNSGAVAFDNANWQSQTADNQVELRNVTVNADSWIFANVKYNLPTSITYPVDGTLQVQLNQRRLFDMYQVVVIINMCAGNPNCRCCFTSGQFRLNFCQTTDFFLIHVTKKKKKKNLQHNSKTVRDNQVIVYRRHM